MRKNPQKIITVNKLIQQSCDIQNKHTHKSFVFLCTSNGKFRNEIKETIVVIVTSKGIKIPRNKFNQAGARLVHLKP